MKRIILVVYLLVVTVAAQDSADKNTAAQNQSDTPTPVISPGIFTDRMIPRDNVEGSFVLQEVGHLQPIAHSAGIIYAVNQVGGRFVAFSTKPLTKILDVPLGLGANSVYAHPTNPYEVWITDSLSNCVSVFSPLTLTLGQTIQTSGSPHALEFSADGSRAYVSCSSGRTSPGFDPYALSHQFVINFLPQNTSTMLPSVLVQRRFRRRCQ